MVDSQVRRVRELGLRGARNKLASHGACRGRQRWEESGIVPSNRVDVGNRNNVVRVRLVRNRIVDLSRRIREIPELLHSIADGAAQLARCWNRRRECIALDFPERFVICEEERLIFLNRTAEATTKLILPELGLHSG